MKKMIRKWLGIEDCVKIKELPDSYYDNIRRYVKEAFMEAFTEIPDSTIHWNHDWGSINCLLKESIKSIVAHNIESKIDKIVGTEEFIDGVVERIKKKQL